MFATLCLEAVMVHVHTVQGLNMFLGNICWTGFTFIPKLQCRNCREQLCKSGEHRDVTSCVKHY